MAKTIDKMGIGNKVSPKDPKFWTGTLVGITRTSPNQYLIGYKDGEPKHPDSWENAFKHFPNWDTAIDIKAYKYFIIVGGKLALQ
jgi:hypothetical protein